MVLLAGDYSQKVQADGTQYKSWPEYTRFGQRQVNLVLIAYASSEGSGEPAQPRSLARTFAARSYKQWVKRNLQTESQIPGPSECWACAVKICHDGMLEDTNSLDGAQTVPIAFAQASLSQYLGFY